MKAKVACSAWRHALLVRQCMDTYSLSMDAEQYGYWVDGLLCGGQWSNGLYVHALPLRSTRGHTRPGCAHVCAWSRGLCVRDELGRHQRACQPHYTVIPVRANVIVASSSALYTQLCAR